ncbi:FecR domain-containing protein [Cyclobacterium roseum]|uniref:FecR domain-containing protein n=1 Tax=Cyclobacterium roseum TaxID=2666137 RepID=UPI001391ECAE|nr:FecR domain-containing protein [Cyclobacterium roseum]
MDDQLLINYLLGETNPRETDQVKQWIAADLRNRAYFEQMSWVWDKSAHLLEKQEVDNNVAWSQFKDRRDRMEEKSQFTPKRIFFPDWLRVAAVITLVILGGWLVGSYLPGPVSALYTSVIFESREATMKEILLDGSVLTLNKNSSLRYSQKLLGNRRLVDLAGGEVYFEVVKNEAKPFVVTAEEMILTVLGTSFHVNQSPEMIEVIVDAGEVKVAYQDQVIFLQKDEKVTIDTASGGMEKEMNRDKLFRYYVEGKFVAESTALPELVEALNKAYGSKIAIGSERAQNMLITTTLEYGSLEKNLEVIRETLGLSIIQKENGIVVE